MSNSTCESQAECNERYGEDEKDEPRIYNIEMQVLSDEQLWALGIDTTNMECEF